MFNNRGNKITQTIKNNSKYKYNLKELIQKRKKYN